MTTNRRPSGASVATTGEAKLAGSGRGRSGSRRQSPLRWVKECGVEEPLLWAGAEWCAPADDRDPVRPAEHRGLIPGLQRPCRKLSPGVRLRVVRGGDRFAPAAPDHHLRSRPHRLRDVLGRRPTSRNWSGRDHPPRIRDRVICGTVEAGRLPTQRPAANICVAHHRSSLAIQTTPPAPTRSTPTLGTPSASAAMPTEAATTALLSREMCSLASMQRR